MDEESFLGRLRSTMFAPWDWTFDDFQRESQWRVHATREKCSQVMGSHSQGIFKTWLNDLAIHRASARARSPSCRSPTWPTFRLPSSSGPGATALAYSRREEPDANAGGGTSVDPHLASKRLASKPVCGTSVPASAIAVACPRTRHPSSSSSPDTWPPRRWIPTSRTQASTGFRFSPSPSRTSAPPIVSIGALLPEFPLQQV